MQEKALVKAPCAGDKTTNKAQKMRLAAVALAVSGAAALALAGFFFGQRAGSSSAASTSASASIADTSKRLDVQRLRGISPGQLLKDSLWGPKLAQLTSPSTQQCFSATVSQLPILQADGAQGVVSSAHGSHAENWVTGYLYAGNDGQIDVALLCDDKSDHLLLLRSRGNDAPLATGLAQWLRDQGSTASAVTLLDGKQQRESTVGELLGTTAPSAALAAAPEGTRVPVGNAQFQAQGGALAVVDADVGQQLVLNRQAVSKVAGDLVNIVDAYRFKDHDLAIVTYACGGSGCTYTPFALIDIEANGQVQAFLDENLVIDADSAKPDVALQPDGSLQISFHSFKGQQRWRYAHRSLTKA